MNNSEPDKNEHMDMTSLTDPSFCVTYTDSDNVEKNMKKAVIELMSLAADSIAPQSGLTF